MRAYFQKEFVDRGVATFDDLAGGSHCMTPAYLQSQINQSLANMKLDTVDLFYIHNPESQLQAVDKYTFEARLAKAQAAWRREERRRALAKRDDLRPGSEGQTVAVALDERDGHAQGP